MNFERIKKVLDASVIEGAGGLDAEADGFYASDLMSDVLAFGESDSALLTGLATRQAVISAHMAEFKGVVFIRGKVPRDASAEFARQNDLILLSTDLDMYECCVRLEAARRQGVLEPRSEEEDKSADEMLHSQEFTIEGSDFAAAGMVSTEIKSVLKKIGLDPKLIRRVAISTYEGEMNVVMHATRARVTLAVTPRAIEVMIDDEGKGIPDVDAAMQEGYTTATEEMRAMGFGSGMGLPNMRRNADDMEVTSEVGKGTCVTTKFFVERRRGRE